MMYLFYGVAVQSPRLHLHPVEENTAGGVFTVSVSFLGLVSQLWWCVWQSDIMLINSWESVIVCQLGGVLLFESQYLSLCSIPSCVCTCVFLYILEVQWSTVSFFLQLVIDTLTPSINVVYQTYTSIWWLLIRPEWKLKDAISNTLLFLVKNGRFHFCWLSKQLINYSFQHYWRFCFLDFKFWNWKFFKQTELALFFLWIL